MAGGKIRRTGAKVRRLSYHVGEREHRIWRPLGQTRKEAWRFKDALLRAARRYDDSTKLERGKGAKMGALGLTGIRVLETLCQIVDNMSGRLEPSIDLIAEKARLSRRTVVRALARLRLHGFIDWLRRTVPLEGDGRALRSSRRPTPTGSRLKGARAAWSICCSAASRRRQRRARMSSASIRPSAPPPGANGARSTRPTSCRQRRSPPSAASPRHEARVPRRPRVPVFR